jgi:hypothetical protein
VVAHDSAVRFWPVAAARPDGKASSGWLTDWYRTAKFGGLQSGTGLLLDFGRSGGVGSATVRLGQSPGSELELRATIYHISVRGTGPRVRS